MQNNKYISLEVAKEAARRAECDANRYGLRFDAECVETTLDFSPLADVRPVVRGEWIDKGYQPYRVSELSFVRYRHVLECSNCHCERGIKYKFCPECGADMRIVQNR